MATLSQNGWPAGSDRAALGIDSSFGHAGVTFPGGVLNGDVSTVFGRLIRRFHAEVEPLVPGHCWGHHYRLVTGGGSLSNHASGTAIDINAPRHPYGKRGTFSAGEVRAIRAILAELEGVVRWGGDYSHPDEMHFEINATRAAVARVAAKLRQPPPTPPKDDDMAELNLDQRIGRDSSTEQQFLSHAKKTGTLGHWLRGQRQFVAGTREIVTAMAATLNAVAKGVAALEGQDAALRADMLAAISGLEQRLGQQLDAAVGEINDDDITPEQHAEALVATLPDAVFQAMLRYAALSGSATPADLHEAARLAENARADRRDAGGAEPGQAQ